MAAVMSSGNLSGVQVSGAVTEPLTSEAFIFLNAKYFRATGGPL